MFRSERKPAAGPAQILLTLTVATALTYCDTESPQGHPTRETLPNGGILVRYPGLPAIDSVGPELTEAQIDLRFGSVEGDDPDLLFGDIRGIQAASDGTICVPDFTATEVRAYDPDGRYLRTIARRVKARARSPRQTGSSSLATRSCGCTITASGRSSEWIPAGTRSAGSKSRS